MATYSATISTHQLAASGVADTVTLGADYAEVEVVNRDGAGEIYFTVGTVASPPATPTIGAADAYVLPAAIGALLVDSNELSDSPTVVKLIASAATKYSVIGVRQ